MMPSTSAERIDDEDDKDNEILSDGSDIKLTVEVRCLLLFFVQYVRLTLTALTSLYILIL